MKAAGRSCGFFVSTHLGGRERRFRQGCKPNSVCAPGGAERIICLSSLYPKPVPRERDMERAAPRFPIWPCSRWGLPCLRDCSWSGGLLPHLFTLTSDNTHGSVTRGGLFSVALSVGPQRLRAETPPASIPGSGLRRLRLRGIAPYGVRTFLLQLAPEAILRPAEIAPKVAEPLPKNKGSSAKAKSGKTR
jgi:hypothetical protein